MKSTRISSLDAVRGAAALLVVITHLRLTLQGHPPAPYLYGMLGGRPSVIVFFVLSGYVLALSVDRNGDGYLPFLVRRMCRIMLPFAAAALLAAALAHVVQTLPPISLNGWFDTSWHAPVTRLLLERHLALTGKEQDAQLNVVSWSLVYEMRVSIIFPALFLFARRSLAGTLACSLGLWAAANVAMACNFTCLPYYSYGMRSAAALTAYFIIFFAAGIGLYLKREVVADTAARIPALLLAIFSLGLLSIENDATLLAGATLVVGAAAAGRFDRVLLRREAVWLGRVSYSLYLVHLPVILALVHVFYNRIPLPFILAAAIPAALLVAEMANRFVEQPAQRLGKKAGILVKAVWRTGVNRRVAN